MDDKHADKYVEIYLPFLEQESSSESKKRLLRLMVKEVERDTRHKATDLAQRLANEISNLDHSK